jgi:hypothetical protein
MTLKEISPEDKANELIEWFAEYASTKTTKSLACIYAAKVAYEIGKTHSLLDENGNFYANFYAKVHSICKQKSKFI